MQKLTVYPNPFVALGPDGMPCGRVLVEPGHPRPLDIFGGKIERRIVPHAEDESRSAKERAAAKRIDVRDVRVRVVANVKMRPIVVALNQYVKERVASGDLIAADKATAAECNITAKDFRQPLDVLRAALARQVAEWEAIHGEPPAVASFELVQVLDEIALAAKDSPSREAPPNVQPLPAAP